MTTIWRGLRNGVAAAGMAGALAFGAGQALAAPQPRAEAGAAVCDVETCRTICKVRYGPFAGGWCDETGTCRCAV